MPMSEEARQARREYINRWRRENPDKVKAQQERHWERVAKQNRNDNKKD